jgi:hypothetical protein
MWSRVEASLKTELDAFDAVVTSRVGPQGPELSTLHRLLEAHRAFLDRTVEYMEAISDKLPVCFVP